MSFKVGDRVSVRLDDDHVYRGCVKRIMPYGNLQLDLAQEANTPVLYPVVHPKQCRRLIRRRVFWIVKHDADCPAQDRVNTENTIGAMCSQCGKLEVIKVREVRT